MIATIPIMVMIVGLLVYLLATNPKAQELGRWMFVCGLFVALWFVGKEMAVILPR